MKPISAKLWLTGLTLALLGAGPAIAATKKPMKHATAHSSGMTTDELNGQSLAAAQQGKPFMPAANAAPPAPATQGAAAPKKM